MVTLWRCSQCGKWSHAKRRPKHHERAVYDEPVDSVRVLRVEPSVFEMDTGAPSFILACGPFDEYRAEAVGETPR
jgi:hypothetical protein